MTNYNESSSEMGKKVGEQLGELEREERSRNTKTLMAFTQATMPTYRDHWHHRALAKMLDRVRKKEVHRLMVFMPPQHGKSELVSRRFPAYLLGKDPNLRLISASHTHRLAVAMNRDVQRILCHDKYQELFPETKMATPRDARTGQFLPRRTMDHFEIVGHTGSLRSVGVGQSIAGLPADGAIIDDPFGKREDADSPIIRQKIWDWYANDLYSRLSADAWIVLTHTRWHRDDLAGRLLRKMADRAADQWEVLCFEAVKETCRVGQASGVPAQRVASEDPPSEARDQIDGGSALASSLDPPYIYAAHLRDNRQPGDALWPDFKSAADLEIIRQQDARAFAALYQQNPAEAANVEWPAELFGEWIWTPPERWPNKFHLGVVCLDASKGSGDKPGDYSAVVFVGVGHDNLLYVDAIVERIPLDQIVRKTHAFCDRYRPDFVGIEAEQFQELLIHEFRRQCGDRFGWSVWKMFTQGVNKVARIRRLTRYVVNRELRFRADSPGCRILVDQLMDFPIADHDDGPDALEMCVRLPVEVKRMR
jgi:predicted phage terminase large subunit-like protein